MKTRLFVLTLVSALFLGITPTSFAADTSAPVLVDWKLLDSKTDISTGDGKLRIEFSISDESRIEDPLSSLSSQSTTQQSGFAFPTLISKVGNVSTYRSEATISFGKAPGLWRWLLFPLRDSLGNSSSGFGPGGSWPVEVWVYDKDFTESKRLAAEAKATTDAKAIADARAAADAKAIADKAAADAMAIAAELAAVQKSNIKLLVDQVTSNVNEQRARLSMLATRYPTQRSLINPVSKSLEQLRVVNEANYIQVEKSLTRFVNQIDSLETRLRNTQTTITCTKGKLTRKVTALKPKCPAGYKVKK